MSRRCDLLGVSSITGNSVSHSNRKTKRRFLPNLKVISFKSQALGVELKIKVTASTIRTINKYSDIDSFLVNFRYNKLTDFAKKLRIKVKKSLVKSGKLSQVKLSQLS